MRGACSLLILAGVLSMGAVRARAQTPGASLPPQSSTAGAVSRREPGSPSGWVALSGHGSLLSDRIDHSNLDVRFGASAAAGARWGRWGVFGVVERNFWLETEIELQLGRGVLNLGVGGEYLYAGGRVRGWLAGGLCVLLEDLALDPAPAYGLFAELRPTGLRWSQGGWWTVVLDPLSLAILAPVLRSPSVVDVQYRTTISVEWQSAGGRRRLGKGR